MNLFYLAFFLFPIFTEANESLMLVCNDLKGVGLRMDTKRKKENRWDL